MVSRIKQLLEWQQLSPTQFADRIGVGRPVVSHILSERNKPSLDVVRQIRAAFPMVSTDWLLDGTGPMLLEAAAVPPLPAQPVAQPLTDGVNPRGSVPPLPAQPAPSYTPTPALPTPIPGVATPVAEAASTPVAPGPSPAPVTATAPSVPTARPFVPPRRTASLPPPARFRPASPAAEPTGVPTTPEAESGVAAPIPNAVAPAPLLPVNTSSQLPGAGEPASPSLPVTAEVATAGVLAASFGEPGKAIRRIVIFYRDGSFADYKPEG